MGDLTLHPHIPDGMFFCVLVCGGGVVCASVLCHYEYERKEKRREKYL